MLFELAQSSPYPQIPYSCLLSLPLASVFETLPSLLSVPSVSAATPEATPEVNSKITSETTLETTPKTTDNSALLQLLFNRVKASTSKEEIHFWSQMCCCAVGRIEKRKVVRVETPVARQNTPLVLQNDSWLSRLKSLHDVSTFITLPSLPQYVSRQALTPRLISLLSSFPSIAYVPALSQHNSLRYLESVDLVVDSYSFPSNFILVVVPPFPPTNRFPSKEHNPISFSSTFPSFVVTPIPRSHFSISLPSFPPSPISTFPRNSPFSPCCRKSA